MHQDIANDLPSWSKDPPIDPWVLAEPAGGHDSKDRPIWGEGRVMTYPGALRHTFDIAQTDLLIEVNLQASAADAGILGKCDGQSGDELRLDGDRHAVFTVASGDDVMFYLKSRCRFFGDGSVVQVFGRSRRSGPSPQRH